jgi:hypothetical protein
MEQPVRLRTRRGTQRDAHNKLIANRNRTVLFLFCTLDKKSTGTAGKDSSWNSEFGQRLRFASSHRIPSPTIGSRAGCSGWKIRQRTSLAVQQQRFDNRQQC